MTIIEPKHPFVMVGVIFLLCLITGAILGYMISDVPSEVKDLFKTPETATPRADYLVDPRDDVPDDPHYSYIYRSFFVVDWRQLPDDAVITNATLSYYGRGSR